MPLEIHIADHDLRGFSEEAREHLRVASIEYTTELIEEANRIEAGINSAGGTPEVTRGMVNDAKVLLRRGLGAPRISIGTKVLRVVSAVLSLAVGIMYDEENLQNGGYMALFVLFVAASILAVTISTMKE